MHPNLIPVPGNDVMALANLIVTMKRVCLRDPVLEEPEYARTKEVAAARAAEIPDAWGDGHTRVIGFPSFGLVTVSLTLDKFPEQTPRWHLSMSRPNFQDPASPLPVPDDLAAALAQAFLGPKYRPIPTCGGFKSVRDYVRDAPEEA